VNAYEEGMALINALRRVPLTPREKWVLCALAKNDEADLTWADGAGVYYLGNERVGTATVKRLLMKVYLSTVYESNTHDYILYTLNEDGRRVAATLGAVCEDTEEDEDDSD